MAGDVFGLFSFSADEDRLSAADRAGLDARRLAVRTLSDVLARRTPLEEAFDALTREERFRAMEARDRAFARAVVTTTLRRRGQLSAIIGHFIEKPLPEKRGRLDAILLCAAAQLIFLKSPPHAVIDLAVHQAREDRHARRFANLANAVLRRVSEQGAALAMQQDAARLNTPDWLWARWADAYGLETAGLIAAQHLDEPPLDLTVKSDPEGWAGRLGGVVLPVGGVRLKPRGRIEDLEGYGEGEWWVQDVAASLPARLLGDVRGKRVADICAAPGGKTAQLAHAGAAVTAVDISAKRLERLKGNLARLGLEAESVAADALEWRPGREFDTVLLDAPCSATGTIRRHPDLPYIKGPGDIPPLLQLQEKLLDAAANLVRPGGALVYAVCSLEPAEGPDRIARLLSARSDFALVPVLADEIGGRGDWLASGMLRSLPHFLKLSDPQLSGMDGFFAARLIRKG